MTPESRLGESEKQASIAAEKMAGNEAVYPPGLVEEVEEIAEDLGRVLDALDDLAPEPVTDGGQERCPTCDGVVLGVTSTGPGTHQYSPCGHPAGQFRLASAFRRGR